ncbi:MAG: hypothetical protein LZF60_140116 [Nitrospira sp.]|nr:MAG: hypothetical protein LZF60_140116 [Nitrospira sp.]
MSIPPAAEPSQYRVTFFFGPEPVEHRPDHLRCVFNVKKRSWKGGVQVGIDIAQEYVEEARRKIDFSTWIEQQLQTSSPEEQEEATRRADELFVQSICTCALNLALHAGIEQHNQVIEAALFTDELRHITTEQPEQVTDRIRQELDLGETSDL